MKRLVRIGQQGWRSYPRQKPRERPPEKKGRRYIPLSSTMIFSFLYVRVIVILTTFIYHKGQ
nr:hypothetical protein pKpnC22_055 [Klebsiella pneumoniae]UHP20757.1 hypothetical protein pEclC18_076 [Enterobacter cloacae]